MFENSKWIGSPIKGVHTGNIGHYRIDVAGTLMEGEEAGIVFGARDKDNYLVLSINPARGTAEFFEYTDEAWLGNAEGGFGRRQVSLGDRYDFKIELTNDSEGHIGYDFSVKLLVEYRKVRLWLNNKFCLDAVEVIPEDPQNKPRKSELMMFGLKQDKGRTIYKKVEITAFYGSNAEVVWKLCADSKKGWKNLGMLGKVTPDGLLVENEFQLIDPVPAVTLAKDFHISQEQFACLESAVLASTARGFYTCCINGNKVGDSYFAPGFTEYSMHLDWQEEDVTQLLKAGKNRILAVVGKGYYSGFCGYSGAEVYGRDNSFLAQVELKYKDGRTEIIPTDESWFYTPCGPVQYGEFQDGEYYDARMEEVYEQDLALPGQENAASGEDSFWEKCGIKQAPENPRPINGNWDDPKEFYLKKQNYPAAKIVETLLPQSKTESPQGHFVFDLGQNMVGTVRIVFQAQRGQSFRIRYGEMCYGNGQVYVENLRTAASTDIYVCKGEEKETFLPEFTAHGFRYVEISGNGYELKNSQNVISVEGLVISNVDKITGDFECSDELLNRLQKNIQWGQRGNFLLVPTDCPQRNERMGWTGDIQVFAPTAVFNMDVKEFLKKWLIDLREAQILYNRDGAAPDTAPLGGDNRTDGCGGWGDAAVFVPWELYQEYKDRTILSDSYDLMRDWVEYQSRPDRETPEGIQTKQRRGDHLAYDTTTPHELCATAYAARSACLLSETAKLLGFAEDAKRYGDRFEKVKKAFAKKWFDETGKCEFPTQTAYCLAIDFGLLNEEQMKGAAEGLKKAIEERETHLSVGFLGISHLLPALSKTGQDELAGRLLMQKECPGWLYSVLNGATTIWERWNSYIAETHTFGDVNMNSFNHYAYGAVGEWIYREVLGIKRLAAGYDVFALEPKALGGLTYAKGYHICSHGRIESAWKVEDGKFLYECRIPDGCSVKVRMPDGAVTELSRGGKYSFSAKQNC